MHCVVLLLCSFVSFSYAQNLKLCDVPKAQKPIVSVNQEYLLKTLYGPFVTAHGHSEKSFIPTNIHPFIYAAHKAFAEHRPLIISPDAVWLMISQGTLIHISENPETFPILSKELKGSAQYSFDKDERMPNSNEDWLSLLNKFSQKAKDKYNTPINDFCKPAFTTTSKNISNAFKICKMTSRSEQFQFGLFSLCGIPEIKLEGKTEDWKKILNKIKYLETIGLSEWADHLKPVLKEFISASEGKIDTKFWNSFYQFNNECGDGSISGWILNFFPYNAKGSMRHLVKAHSADILKNIPDSNPNMSFPSGRNHLPFSWGNKGTKVKMRFEAGFMGISQDPQTLALKAEINWAVIKNSATGNLSVWQQNVVRENTVGKQKLSAAYSANYIDIDNFVNEADTGLKNLKLLEYVIIKKPVRGTFLKDLVSLPNFKELECHDWNIEHRYMPYISKLKNKSFSFNKETNSEFFAHLPSSTKRLTFKDMVVKAKYLANLNVNKLEKIYFENCHFEANALACLKAKIDEVHIHRSKGISQETLKELNSLKSLNSLSITSCKLRKIPDIHLKNLHKLNLNSNLLQSIAALSELKSLRYLNLANNQIQGIVDFNKFQELEELIVHHNALTDLQLSLAHLISLHASNNKLTKLPIINSKQLKTLIVEKNLISEAVLPSNISSTLETLILETVHLNRANTQAIGSMKNLKELSLKNCALINDDICEFEKLQNLQSLKIWTNRKLTDECKASVIRLFSLGAEISIFDCGFSASAMEEFAKHREKFN